MDPRRALALATLGYVTGLATHMTFSYHLAPLALRAAGETGRDVWVFSGVAVAMMLAVLPAGWLADRVPRRRVFRAGLALQALAALPLALAEPSFGGVLVGTASTGAGLGLMLVSFNSYVGDLLAEAQLGPAYGMAGALSIMGSAAGPFLASLLLRAAGEPVLGLRLAAGLLVALPLAGVLVTFRLPQVRHDRPTLAASIAPGGAEPWRREARVVAPVMLLYVVLGIGYGMTAPYFATYFLDVERLDGGTWGLFLAAGTFASAVGSLVAGRLLVRVAPGRLVLASQTLLVASCAVFLAPVGVAALGLAFVARSLFSTSVAPVVNVRLVTGVRPTSRAQAQGFASVAWNAGWATGGLLGGALLASLGGALFAVGAVVGLAGVAVGLWWTRA